jgi:hypothetical protein
MEETEHKYKATRELIIVKKRKQKGTSMERMEKIQDN